MAQAANSASVIASSKIGETRLVVSATFTADPIEPFLRFWMKELGIFAQIEFTEYNQIFQQLIDPNSAFARNRSGTNIIFARLEDWVRFKPGGWDEATLTATVHEFALVARAFAEQNSTHTILCVTPPSGTVEQNRDRAAVIAQLETHLREQLAPFRSLHWLGTEALARYPVQRPLDDAGDRVGHMPYTPAFLAAASTAVARRIHAIKCAPYKVIALDCDNTLWDGVVGEDGPQGIRLGPGANALQKFVVAQQAAGMLICLVSKNVEVDVFSAFEARSDFPLQRSHLTAWRINWLPKSRSLVELAEELNVGIDSFVFLDDNPIECAEVRAALPQVLTLQVPPGEGMADFLSNIWAFDKLTLTAEDRNRTAMYQQNAARAKLRQQAGDIGAFLASLDLKICITAPADGQWERVSQLTQKTNQFNFTTIRRTEAEVRRCSRAGLACLCVEVSDRFGDYGLVGVMLVGASDEALVVDTLLLSCRVLGRGVEHAMLAHLGRLAADRDLAFVEVRFLPTPKNEPAARFLQSIASAYSAPAVPGEAVYRIPTSIAGAIAYRPGDDAHEQLKLSQAEGESRPAGAGGVTASTFDKQVFYARAATTYRHADALVRHVEEIGRTVRALAAPPTEPSSALQRELVAVWGRILNVAPIGIDDEFGALGGTSILCARLFADLETNYGIRLPMSTILEAPTVRTLADRLSPANRDAKRQSLKPLKAGTGSAAPLFLVHDGDGETLLYMNLARRLPDELSVYGLEPLSSDRCPMVHTSIKEMAAYYVDRIREVCPSGPYLLGGLCAGGVIAFEMALQLRATGLSVGFVALLDAADARAVPKPYLRFQRRWDRLTQALRKPARQPVAATTGHGSEPPSETTGRHRLGNRIKQIVTVTLSKFSNLVRFEVTNYMRQAAVAKKIRALRGAAGSPTADHPNLTVRDCYEYAEQNYAPTGRLDTALLLIRAGADGVNHTADEPLKDRLRDPDFGWRRRLAVGHSSLAILDAPGGHGGMLQEPHVAVVAAHLRDALEQTAQ